MYLEIEDDFLKERNAVGEAFGRDLFIFSPLHIWPARYTMAFPPLISVLPQRLHIHHIRFAALPTNTQFQCYVD
jgi:hypothetical protein